MKLQMLLQLQLHTSVHPNTSMTAFSHNYLREREDACEVCGTFLESSLSAVAVCCPGARFRSALPPTVTTGRFEDVIAGKQCFCKQWFFA